MNSGRSGEKTSWLGASRDFVIESVGELKKITRPTREETMQAALITVVIMMFISICLFLLDLVFSRIIGALLV